MKKWQLISLISSSVIFGVTILTTIGVIASRLQQHNENNTIDSGMISINVTLADGHYGSDIRSNSGPIHCSEGYSASIGKEFIVNTLECFYYSYFFPYTSPSGEYFCEMTFGKEPQPESDWQDFKIEHIGLCFYLSYEWKFDQSTSHSVYAW